MPKSKKPTPTQRQTPYPTPATPANISRRSTPAAPTNTRSTPTVPPNSSARFLRSSLGFALGYPNPAYPQTTLTPYEAGQSIHDFCLDLQNGTKRPGDVDEDVHLGPAGIRGVKGDGKSAYDAPGTGERSGARRKGRVERVVRDGAVDPDEEISKTSALSKRKEDKGPVDSPLSKRQSRPPNGPSKEQVVRDGAIDHGEIISKTLKLSKRWEDKEISDPPSIKDQDQPPIGFSENPPTILGPYPPEQYTNSPKESTPSDPDLAPPNSLTEEEICFAKLLKPVSDFNARTPCPVPFYGQPVSPPTWHANCPDGYEPTTLAGCPQRRQYSTYISAARDADIVRDESGHYCLDLDEWDRCVMGKCGGCEICSV